MTGGPQSPISKSNPYLAQDYDLDRHDRSAPSLERVEKSIQRAKEGLALLHL